MFKRIISTLMALLMLLSAFAVMASAEETESKPEYTYNTSSDAATIDYLDGSHFQTEQEIKDNVQKTYIKTEDDKLATMDLRFEKDGYQLYVDAYSGEVAVKCIATGENLFTNPYSVGTTTIDPKNPESAVDKSIKEQLLSQLVVKYTTVSTGTTDTFYSYSEVIQGETNKDPYPASQIKVKNIKNGIRVEYSIGKEEARLLVPRQIKKETFIEKILTPMAEALGVSVDDRLIRNEDVVAGEYPFELLQTRTFYVLYDPYNSSAKEVEQMQARYKVTKKMAIFVLDGNLSSVKRHLLEKYIKTYCPNYSFEDLDADHLEAEYEGTDVSPPLFKMALEYTLDENGVSVRLPANGIRFNETLYRLDSIDILPYMGAGNNANQGEVFYPDGSGALFDFQQGSMQLTGKVYGQDYAYHTITGSRQEVIRYPVIGLNETVVSKGVAKDRGFVAIVEEGDALMELSTQFDATLHPYNSVRMIVYPRPTDTYNLDNSGTTSNSTWTVVSDRKYTGNYKVRYVMLTDDKVAQASGLKEYYACNYMGMAQAYRDYLESKDLLSRLTADDVDEDLPLYIETFGAIETTKRVLSVPVKTMLPLTSFEQVQKMHEELSAEGVDNVNFILTGYNKGGITAPTYPNKIDWEESVGGKTGFEDLMAYAKENDVGIFPDFDYAFYANNNLTDGVNLKKHAVKTIDNRYTSKRVYSATKQSQMSYYELAMSPAYFSVFYEALTEDYKEYDPTGISVSTLGSYLNSDFDKKDPYNREDGKAYTVKAFQYFEENYDEVMTSGGNAYTWSYVDHITDIALDSSRYIQASAAVPFLGIVLHGYVQFAGTPINMEGNTDYALLKAIENGASLNFVLSYQNTNLLKEDELLSQNFSVRYDIWFSDVVSMYKELNSVLADVQTSIIVGHEFIPGYRVADKDEILKDMYAVIDGTVDFERELAETADDEKRQQLLDARQGIESNTKKIKDTLYESYYNNIDKLLTLVATYNTLGTDLETATATLTAARAAYDAIKNEYNAAVEALAGPKAALEAAQAALAEAVESGDADAIAAAQIVVDQCQAVVDPLAAAVDVYQPTVDAYNTAVTERNRISDERGSTLDKIRKDAPAVWENYAPTFVKNAYDIQNMYEQSVAYMAYLRENSNFSDEFLAEIEANITPLEATYNDVVAKLSGVSAKMSELKAALAAVGVTMGDFVMPERPTTAAPAEKQPSIANVSGRYYSNDNKIVLLTYENGKQFILNFNSFAVTTKVGNVVYTVDAYGYVVIK